MSMAALRWARTVRGIGATEKLVLLLLADYADEHAVSWPSVAGLAADGCMGERTVQRALADLCQAGLILRSGTGGRGLTCRYTLAISSEQPETAPDRHPNSHPERVPDTTERVPNNPERVPDWRERVSDRHPIPQDTPRHPKDTPKKRARAPRLELGVPLPAWLPPEVWSEWDAFRRKLTPDAWTERAAELLLIELGRLKADGHDPSAVVRQSIAYGWRGFFPLKGQRIAASAPQPQNRESRADWIWRELEGRAGPEPEARNVTATIIDLPKGAAA